MRHLRCASWSRRLLPCVLLLAELAVARAAAAQDDQKTVLVLYSTRRDAEISVIGENELPRILDSGLDRNLDYYSEFIDVTRFPDAAYQRAFGDFIRQKYQGVTFDLVIAIQDVAVEFLNRNRARLFADAPELVLANTSALVAGPKRTGLILERNYAATVTLIDKLQPEVKDIFVITGAAPADKGYELVVRSQLRPFEARFKFTYLSGLPTPELERRLASLPARSVVYHILVSEDGAGNKFHPLEYVDRVAAAANVPTYCWVDSAIGHGIVGGSLYSQKGAMERVAQLALRVLEGERPENSRITAIDLNGDRLDWRQLRRWRIDEARVPASAFVQFREPTIWDRYRGYVIGTVAVLLVQSVLIAGLLIQRVRRRLAENELRRSQAQLSRSVDRIRDLGARLLDAQETERARIARELHDDISQQMALLTMDLEALGDDGSGDGADGLDREALTRAQEISKSVHDLSHQLHPTRLRLIGLVAALHALRQELASSGIPITFTHDNVPASLPPDLMLCLFRIVQEALQNAVKYSHASGISVQLNGDASGLTLVVADDGVGFDVESVWGKGLGLVSMRERVEAIGGFLELKSAAGVGTRLSALIPQHVVLGTEGSAPTKATAVLQAQRGQPGATEHIV